MNLLSTMARLNASTVPFAALAGEELLIVIKALERSAAAMPEHMETVRTREIRAARETKLAERLRGALV